MFDSRSLQQFFQGRAGLRAERSRPRVMFSGKFLRCRLGCDENDRQIKVRVGILGILRNSLKNLLLCFFLPPFLACRNTEVIVRGGAVWIDLNGLPQLHKRIVKPGLTIMNNAECGEHKIVIGREGQGFPQR